MGILLSVGMKFSDFYFGPIFETPRETFLNSARSPDVSLIATYGTRNAFLSPAGGAI